MKNFFLIILIILITVFFALVLTKRIVFADKNYNLNINYGEKSLKIDGPYIEFLNNDSLHLISVNIDKTIVKNNQSINNSINCETQSGSTFSFKVESNINDNSAKTTILKDVEISVISDIEGNFKVFNEFLMNNNIIDSNFNWIYNNNHLVINGDTFDRGEDVIACLWLIYKLDYQSKEKGGGVHFIIGNHEELNLRGYVKYVKLKYLGLANELGIEYKELYSKNTVLGKWLRTKNSAEIINNNLFVHGGISTRNIKEKLDIHKINNITRKYLGVDRRNLEDSSEADLVFDRLGNMWYRGFFMDYKKYYKRLTENEVDDILNFYNVEHIIVGHSIVEKVKTEYNNKVIAIDVMSKDDPRREDGDAVAEKTEGLLIKEDMYFRLLQNGRKHLLFK